LIAAMCAHSSILRVRTARWRPGIQLAISILGAFSTAPYLQSAAFAIKGCINIS
jgi:hypothetical protein